MVMQHSFVKKILTYLVHIFFVFIQIGKSLPCIDSVSEVTALEVNKSLSALDFHDLATFPIGPTCPIDRGSFVPENTKDFPIQPDDNQFRARVIYELAKSDAITADSK